ncbi:MAG: hypothetical protein HRU41_22980 [Saprospiraceae bacterium]|nr:hypothetical protein [Saprospiraceae bacterium]
MSLIEPKQLSALQESWWELTEQVGLPQNAISDSWAEISSAYQSAERYYHNLIHISDMLGLWKQHRSDLKNANLLALCIWFHDLVYQVDRKDNEQQSAERAVFYLGKSELSTLAITQVYQSILATQYHQLSFDYPDLAYLLDFDLAVLGRDWERYVEYTKQIRKEYSIYPDELYRPGRKKVLEHFLARENLYFTSYAQGKWEAQARLNLKMELSSL